MVVQGEPTILQIVSGVVADLLQQCVPGSVVLLLLAVCLLPYIFYGIRAYWSRRTRNGVE